ncbi:MAG: YezD family protein [Oscillospiraceae bacterium]|nr:YezD family protein [Oscillospiraceae bacterium]
MAEKDGGSSAFELAVSEQEKKIILLLREIKFGEVKIVMQNGVPVRIDEIRKSIKL